LSSAAPEGAREHAGSPSGTAIHARRLVLATRGAAPVVAQVLGRRSALSRSAAGRATAEQVLAANVDLVLVVQGLDEGAHPRRLERTLAAVHASGAEPAIVLTKPDLVDDPRAALAEAEALAGGAPVLAALDPGRVEERRKPEREAALQEARRDGSAARAERPRWKGIRKELRRVYRDRGRT
jgi:hypothetical protein